MTSVSVPLLLYCSSAYKYLNQNFVLPVCHSAAFIFNSRWQRLQWNRSPQALDVFRDDAIVKRARFDAESGLGGRSESLIGKTDAENRFDVFRRFEFWQIGFVFVVQVSGERQPVRNREFVGRVVWVEKRKNVEGRLRGCHVRRFRVRREQVGDGGTNFAAMGCRFRWKFHWKSRTILFVHCQSTKQVNQDFNN